MKRISTAVVVGLALATLAFAAERQPERAKTGASEKAAAEKSEQGEQVKTPFGYVKKRDVKKPAEQPRPAKPNVEVKVDGDTVRFKRKTPFGVQAWTRSRGDLSDAERKLVDQAGVDLDGGSNAAKPASAEKADQGKP